ncbi:hypothetical protein AGR6A_Cc140231 [Agrobacterium sp. NCPPB 925]|nr:hypothetical protein AGR6A_Cc140231 [Agrobacterium sp. NCPPB 925]
MAHDRSLTPVNAKLLAALLK